MPTPSEKSRVARWVRKWQRRALLVDWKIKIDYRDCVAPEEAKYERYEICETIDAQVSVLYRYHRIDVTIYAPFWEDSVEDQERVVLHELIHGHTQHSLALALRRASGRRVTEEEAADVNEVLTQWAEDALWGAFNGTRRRA